MDIKNFRGYVRPFVGAVVLMLAASMQQNALALDPIKIGDVDIGMITGYLREHAQWNLQDRPDLQTPGGKPIDGQGEMSMLRTTLQVQYVNPFLPNDMVFTFIGRLVKESRTTYLKKLDAMPKQTGDLMDYYNTNREAIREAYLDIPFSEDVKLRFGKQQVVWGETDQLQALDIVNGRDLSWRGSSEPENEDWRIPTIMANLNIAYRPWNGSMQLLYRPGWDREDTVGSKLDLFGGRNAGQGSRGSNSLVNIGYNYHHPEGDADDPSYGFRWTGVAGESNIGYSLAYYHTLRTTPVLNVSAPGITPYKGSIGSQAGVLIPGVAKGEFILPAIDYIGGSLNAYVEPLDLAFRSELVYTPGMPYNANSATFGAALPTIKEKNTARFMVGFDKSLRLMNSLGTDSASTWTVQVFDSWITGFDASDKLLDTGITHLKAHSVVVVTTLGLSYALNQIQPGISVVLDTSNGGGSIGPNVSFLYGDHWRLRLDSTFYFPGILGGCSTDPVTKSGANCTHGFGTQDNNNFVSARLTYQF